MEFGWIDLLIDWSIHKQTKLNEWKYFLTSDGWIINWLINW